MENLQQKSLVAALYGADPFGLVDEIENMNGQGAACFIEIHPEGARRGRDDACEHRQAVRIPELKRNCHKPGASPSLETKDDTATATLDRTMSARTKAANRTRIARPPWANFRRLKRRERQAPDKSEGPGQKDLPRRQRLIEYQPKHEHACARYRKGK